MSTAPSYAPTETDLALADGNAPPLTRYDPTAQEPEFLFEVVNGYVVRKTVGVRVVRLANRLSDALGAHIRAGGLGQSFIELGYDFSDGGPRRKPDVSFLSERRWPADRDFPDGDFAPVTPHLAVEVISPHELAHTMFDEVEQYFRAGVAAVWAVVPKYARVYCHSSPTQVRILSRGDDLAGDPVVPGFRMPVADLFPPAAP